jgi:hypothetical protein
MNNIYFARTDNTGDLTRFFPTQGEAMDWAEDHARDEATVWCLEL